MAPLFGRGTAAIRRFLFAVSVVAPLFAPALIAPAVGAQSTAEADDEVLAEAALLETALKPWKGDLDGMVGRNMIRVAIPFGIATYFLDGGAQKGPTYDLAVAFEQSLKKKLGVKDSDLTMVVVPARRDEIFQMLVDGKADIAAGTLTITEERARPVDFSLPFMKGGTEVVITGPEVPAGAGGTEEHTSELP